MNVDFWTWFKAAGIRAIKTFAQTACGLIGGELVGIVEVDYWAGVLSVAATAALLSLLTSVAGLPELGD